MVSRCKPFPRRQPAIRRHPAASLVDARQLKPAHSVEFDYVIVGAGTAGCVLANRLSADPEKQVLLVEAGGNDDYFWINIPVGYLYTIGNPRTDWCFETAPQAGLNGRSIGYARGKVLGGCSSINAMIYMRGQATDYDHWAQLGNRGWGWDDVLPIFKRTEDYQHGMDAFHGSAEDASLGGELRVEERAGQLADSRRLARGRRAVRDSEDRGVQPWRQFRDGLLPDEPAPGRSRQRIEGVPPAGDVAPESHRDDRCPSRARPGRNRTLKRKTGDGDRAALTGRSAQRPRHAARPSWRRVRSGRRTFLQLSGIGPPPHLSAHGVKRRTPASGRRRQPA